MVVFADAVIHPVAVVVVVCHTLVADVAVTRGGLACHFTLWAQVVWVQSLYKRKEWKLGGTFKVPWVR